MRIVTRPDFDGIVSAVLLSDALNISSPVLWAEPNDMQHGRVDVRPGDIIANLSYHPGCSMWFDHHMSNHIPQSFEGDFKLAPSAARVIFDYYKNDKTHSFGRDYKRLIKATDKIDSANLSEKEVLNPENYPYLALSITIASHSPEDAPYWNRLVELMKKQEVEETLRDPEVSRRVQKAVKQNKTFIKLMVDHTTRRGHVTVSDYRPLGYSPKGNRFFVFHLHPESVVNIRVRYDETQPDKRTVRLSVGHSIFNRNCNVNAGFLCSHFGGGGHRGAGACSVPVEIADSILAAMLEVLDANQPSLYPILFEDDSYIAVQKPAQFSCENNFCRPLARYLEDRSGFTGNLQVVLPLPKESAGTVVMSKSKEAADAFAKNKETILKIIKLGD